MGWNLVLYNKYTEQWASKGHGIWSYSRASYRCNLPTSKKYFPQVLPPQKRPPCRCMFKYYDFTIQTLHRGKESHIACRSTLEVKLVCTNMIMLRCSHLHSSCLLTHTYILYTVYYVLSMVYMFEYSRLIMHAIEFLERWNFNYCHLESGYVSCIHYTVGYGAQKVVRTDAATHAVLARKMSTQGKTGRKMNLKN